MLAANIPQAEIVLYPEGTGAPEQSTVAALLTYMSGAMLSSGDAAPDAADAVSGVDQVYLQTTGTTITAIAFSATGESAWETYTIASGGGGGVPFDFSVGVAEPNDNDADVGQDEIYWRIDGDGNLIEIAYSSALSGVWSRLPIAVGTSTNLAGVPGLGSPFVTKTLISSPNPGADELFFDENVQPDVHRVTFRNTGGQYPPDFLDSDLIDGYFYMKASPSGAIRTGPIDSVSESSSNLYEIEFVNIVVSGSETDFPDSGSCKYRVPTSIESWKASKHLQGAVLLMIQMTQ